MKEIFISAPARIEPPRGVHASFDYPHTKFAEITVARSNRSQILLAAQEIESQLTSIIESYLFQTDSEQHLFFAAHISRSNWFSFDNKRRLVKALVDQQQISKEAKDNLNKHLAKVVHWRNMFAHGDIFAKDDGAIYIVFFEGNRQEKLLNDDYFAKIVTGMERTPVLLREINWPTA